MLVDVEKYNLNFTHPEQGKHYTEIINFIYTLEKTIETVDNEEDLKYMTSGYIRNGEVRCSDCDEEEDGCECEDKISFSEIGSMYESMCKSLSTVIYDLQEMDTSMDSVLEFVVDVFKETLKTLPEEGIHGELEGVTEYISVNTIKELIGVISTNAEHYNQCIKKSTRNSLTEIKLINKPELKRSSIF